MLQYDLPHNSKLNVHRTGRGALAVNQESAIAHDMNIVYGLFGALQLLLIVRVIVHLVAADDGYAFARVINGLSAPFVVLFAHLLRNPVLGTTPLLGPALSTTAVLEITTLIAMIAYGLLAWLVGRVVWLTLSRPR